MTTVYDVTDWTIPGSSITCFTDIGAVINSMISDIKSSQSTQNTRPGAVIYIPPGHYSLKTRVTVDVSYLAIRGSGHGFTSLSIRYNTASTGSWWETIPGGSHIAVENTDGHNEAFIVTRSGDPRLSSIQFENFCLDGVSFSPNQNSYLNGKVGIRVDSATDSTRIRNMGMVYLEHALIVSNADALDVTGNFIAECGNCVELVGSGQASKVTNNLIGAGFNGFSIFAESFVGLLVSGNNVFPRGASSVHFKNCARSTVTSNRFHAFYPGVVVFEGACSENLIGSNHFFRQPETYGPFQSSGNGRDDLFGIVQVGGDGNSVIGNHISFDVPTSAVSPSGATPTIVLVKSGNGNYIATNHVVANQAVKSVVLDASTTNTTVVDSATSAQFLAYSSSYGFRATP
jgi:inulin fructotransferase (DFA-I-forming)